MANDMIGDKVLPEAVQGRRRSLRTKLRELRRPLRQKRQSLVPGPDVIGKVESTAEDLRTKLVDREAVLERIKDRRTENSQSSSTNSSSSTSTSTQSGTSEMV